MIEYIIDNYTNEAGVRDIKRKIEDIYLHLNIEKLYSKGLFSIKKYNKTKKIENQKKILTKEKIIEILRDSNINEHTINLQPAVGIICGLYATSNGSGGITPIQIFSNYNTIHEIIYRNNYTHYSSLFYIFNKLASS